LRDYWAGCGRLTIAATMGDPAIQVHTRAFRSGLYPALKETAGVSPGSLLRDMPDLFQQLRGDFHGNIVKRHVEGVTLELLVQPAQK